MVQVDGALWEAGRARAVEPHARVIRCGVGWGELGLRRREELFQRQDAGWRLAAGDDHMPKPRRILARLEDLRKERRRREHGDRPAVVQDVGEVARREQGVRRDRDRADLDRAEERVGELRRVEAEDDDPLLHPYAQLAQRVPEPVDAPRELAVRDGLALTANRDARVADAAVRVDERLRRVVPGGQLPKTRLTHGSRLSAYAL